MTPRSRRNGFRFGFLLLLAGNLVSTLRAASSDADTRLRRPEPVRLSVAWADAPDGTFHSDTMRLERLAELSFLPVADPRTIPVTPSRGVWLRLTLPHPAPVGGHSGYLDIGWPRLKTAVLYQKNAEGALVTSGCHAGRGEPFLIPVRVEPGNTDVGTLFLQGHPAGARDLMFLPQQGALWWLHLPLGLKSIWTGVFIFLALYGLYYWRMTGNRACLWHVLHLICLAGGLVLAFFPLNQFLEPQTFWRADLATAALFGGGMAFACLYARRALELARPSVRSRLLGHLALAAAVVMPLSVLLPEEWALPGRWAAVTGYAALLAAFGFRRWREGFAPARLLTAAWCCLAAGAAFPLAVEAGVTLPFSAARFAPGAGFLAEMTLILCAETRALIRHVQQDHETRALAHDLSNIFQGLHSGIALIDRDYNILFSNPAMGTIVGNDGNCPGGKCFQALFDDNAPCEECPLPDVLEFGSASHRLFFREDANRDPELRTIQSSTSPVTDPRTGKIDRVLVEFRDITDQLETELQLRQTEKLSAIGQLAGGIAHDFNNQLTIIQGFVETILAEDTTPSHFRQSLEKVRTAALRSADLTRQLLTFSRKAVLSREPINLHALIDETIHLLSRSLDKRITIRQELAAESPTIQGDQSQVQSALLNLALNARDAMPSGGQLSFETRVVVLDEEAARQSSREVEAGPFVEVIVTDTGCGMSRDILAHIFEPYFTTKPVGKGTGMGLAAVYGTVKNHGGYIFCESRVGQGTRFQMGLPQVRDSGRHRAHDTTTVLARDRATIMVIDDEADVAQVTARMLESLGYRVKIFDHGQAALAYYRERGHRIGLVLLDMIMPDMHGSEVFDALRDINPNAHVLLMSGYSLTADLQRLRAAGAVGFIEKPFDFASLSRTVRNIIDPPDTAADSDSGNDNDSDPDSNSDSDSNAPSSPKGTGSA